MIPFLRNCFVPSKIREISAFRLYFSFLLCDFTSDIRKNRTFNCLFTNALAKKVSGVSDPIGCIRLHYVRNADFMMSQQIKAEDNGRMIDKGALEMLHCCRRTTNACGSGGCQCWFYQLNVYLLRTLRQWKYQESQGHKNSIAFFPERHFFHHQTSSSIYFLFS